jgi:predicted metal-dependent hydrolase
MEAVYPGGVELLKTFLQHIQERRYFEAHEVLEEAWRKAEGQEKRFLQGLILLAAALHQEAGNRGGLRNLRKAEASLRGLPSPYLGLDWRPLLEEARRRLGA